MIPMVRLGILGILSAGTLGCSPKPRGERDDAVIRVDTLGDTITVLTSGSGAWGANPRVVQTLAIGDRAGDKNYELGKIRDLVVGRDGSIFLYDQSALALRQYDSTGKFIRRIGREGEGPGEYRDLEGLALTPDGRVLAYDFRGLFIHVYDSTGKPLEELGPIDSRFSGRENTLMVGKDGRIRVAMATTPETPSDVTPPRFGYFVVDRSGRILDTVFQPEPRVRIRYAPPYSPRLIWTLGSDGDTLTVFSSDQYLVTLIRGSGKVYRFGRQGLAPVSVSPAEKAAIEKAFEEERRLYAGDVPDMGAIPSVKPAIRAIRIAEDGRVWVSPHVASIENPEPIDTTLNIWDRPPRWFEPPIWDVFEQDGRFLGRLEFPLKAAILRSRGLEAWGVVPDSNDVPTVVRWAINPDEKEK